MKRFNVEIVVGLFMLLGFGCFGYLSIKLGDVNLFGTKRYTVQARFGSVAGLKLGASVNIAGVEVGKVTKIGLDPVSYDALVSLEIDPQVELQDDSIASIRTAGMIGDRYVSISPGGAPSIIPPGGELVETESSINLEELISKYIFDKK
ncbi:MAG: outer membrane lipid asymmetry maintenance protein MlaD [Desulfuromonas sp.]|nr:outer membrane lipid asymmetry maintenance protein MlaD [Desulfuromonas sp.]